MESFKCVEIYQFTEAKMGVEHGSRIKSFGLLILWNN